MKFVWSGMRSEISFNMELTLPPCEILAPAFRKESACGDFRKVFQESGAKNRLFKRVKTAAPIRPRSAIGSGIFPQPITEKESLNFRTTTGTFDFSGNDKGP